jgi:hypothetical protein
MREAQTFSRGWISRAAMWSVIAAGWLVVGALGVWFLALVLEPGWSYGKVFNALVLLLTAARVSLSLMQLRRWARDFAKNRMVVDEAGVRGRFGTEEWEFGWPEVTGVSRGGARGAYVLTTSRGPVAFSAIDIPSPKRAARTIAARIGTAV